jgi:L,D-transpeptidase YcbB
VTRGRAVALLAAVVVIASASLPAEAQAVPDAIERTIQGRPELTALYRPTGFVPLWVGSASALNQAARDAIQLLGDAADEGLEPADYHVAELHALVAGLRDRPALPDAIARTDVALSESMLRYFRDLHMGRIDPRPLGFFLNVPKDGHDFATLLREAAAKGQLVQTARAWTPRDPQYPALGVALRRYRTLAEREPDVLAPLVTAVRPGERYGGLPALRARLRLLGDLDPQVSLTDGDLYGGAIVDAVKHFQRRHGLDPDGVLGTKTLAQLAVPLAWRVRQLELAMERLRWLPHQADERLILVNTPMFRLFAWDTIPPEGAPSFTTRVIVGRAMKTHTPVFAATLSEVIFRPYWNVPTSIVRKEILPILARQPEYLEREHLELVAGQSDRSPVVEATPENLARLQNGLVRLRQRPGPDNALGRIKFSFPNEADVYMHATPAQALFARSRRDFSHGCVRVEDPVGLAEWILRSQPGWDRGRIVAAMDATVSSRVAVQVPLRVVLFYTTAAVLPESGDVAFADDIYQNDAVLDRALRTRAP